MRWDRHFWKLYNTNLLIKPNKEELEDLFKVKIDNLKEIVFWSRKLLALGAKNVIVSLGKKAQF